MKPVDSCFLQLKVISAIIYDQVETLRSLGSAWKHLVKFEGPFAD